MLRRITVFLLIALVCVARLSAAQAVTQPFATYLGTPADEKIVAVDTDAGGATYVFGATQTSAGPPFTTSFSLPTPTGNPAACYLAKITGAGPNVSYWYVALITDTTSCDAMSV